MIGEDADDEISIEDVRSDEPSPETKADRQTAEEQTLHEFNDKMSRSAAYRSQYYTHDLIETLKIHVETLKNEISNHADVTNHQKYQIEFYPPNYYRLKQGFQDLKGSTSRSSLMMFAGSVIVSFAGAREQSTEKTVLLTVGIVISFCGLFWSLWALNSIKDEEVSLPRPPARNS